MRVPRQSRGVTFFTYLANKSGWDARAVALAALADQFSRHRLAKTESENIAPAFYYALFRAGLPTNSDTLYHVEIGTVVRIWQRAMEQGVIPKVLEKDLISAAKQFQTLGVKQALSNPALVGVSSLKEMLTTSQLDDDQQTKFVKLYATHRTDLQTFWKTLRSEIGEPAAQRLQVNGKLLSLTLNNAPLVSKVHAATRGGSLSHLIELAQQGYYRAEAWRKLLTETDPIPKEIPGDKPEEKRANYADCLAAQVRLSYPTASIAHMIKSGDLPLTGATAVHAFLTDHQGKFEIGTQPIQQYIALNNVQNVDIETVTQIKRIQRVYQITPSDEAMTGLMKRKINAAYDVMRYDKDTFVRTFSQDVGGDRTAAIVYDRSAQVYNAVLNIVTSYITAKNGIALGAQSLTPMEWGKAQTGQFVQPQPQGPAAHASDVIPYGTLETLFGELDFCACDHCRSILSPAAYLVDLLRFLDKDGGETPLSILLSRRPDIQHLPLTCENTNTALPYIDVVNETLEYFVASNKLSLDGYVGHDSNGMASEDLLASPQFVNGTAYNTLRGACFPSPLPFHQPLESLRRYFNKFEAPLPLAMERLRKNDDLERGANPYGWRDILMEELSLSRAEHQILTDSHLVPLWRMYGFSENEDVIAGLSNAKKFARRVEITYEDLVAILKTRFVNPFGNMVPKMERLRINFASLYTLYHDTQGIKDAEFNAHWPAGAETIDPAAYGCNPTDWENKYHHNLAAVIRAWLSAKDDRGEDWFSKISKLITLMDSTIDPNQPNQSTEYEKEKFENFEFRYAVFNSSGRLGAVEFVRLLRFIRLWKKIGWTIEQTDAAICALYKADTSPLGAGDIDTMDKLDAGFRLLLPRLGIVARLMKALNLTPKRELLPLLACWSDIGTHGETALYRQMFLNPAIREQDAVFVDNGYGEFLRDDTQKVTTHAEALRSAFNLTAAEFCPITADLGFKIFLEASYNHPQPTLDQAILDAAPGIRYDDLNKKLFYTGVLSSETRDKLKTVAGVSEDFHVAVEKLFGANSTLTALTLSNISAIFRRGWLARKLKLSVRELLLLIQLTGLDPFSAPDLSRPAILRLIALVQALRDRSLKTEAALYLIWNQDLSGKSAPEPAQVAAFARSLRLNFAAVEADFAVVDDPDGAITQSRMALVYGADTAAFFFGLLNNTFSVEVDFNDPDRTLANDKVRQAIDQASGLTDTGTPKIAFDDFRKKLSYAGVFTVATRDALLNVTGVGPAFKTTVSNLYAKHQDAMAPFFARYPELQQYYEIYVSDPKQPVTEKRSALLKQMLPTLVTRRKEQQALQAVSAAAQTSLEFAQTLLCASPGGFALHAHADAQQSALSDFLALETQGLSAEFFANEKPEGGVISSKVINIGGSRGNSPSEKPIFQQPKSGIWRGYLEAPDSGCFKLYIETDLVATVMLKLDGKSTSMSRQSPTKQSIYWTNADAIELRAGTLYPIEVAVKDLIGILRIQWEWEPKGQGRTVIPARYLYPAAQFEAFRETYLRFLKVTALATNLGLTANEVACFATHPEYRINVWGRLDPKGHGWLNAMPNVDNLRLANPKSTAVARELNASLLRPLSALLDFARIKTAISPTDESLLNVLKDPVAATLNSDSLLYAITRWDAPSLKALLSHFDHSLADLSDFALVRRVYDAFALIKKTGISGQALIAATTNEPQTNQVRNLQTALRARYDAAAWRDVAKPINDEMRGLQRDALVAYILHQMRSMEDTKHIDTANKLFEYFLMDVEMEPSMQTSRIRHALSSVQLFIERCLMNLEPRVSPVSINAKRWEWMKRYRVWEANRKVFLFPENWLEPELRDNQSPFFKEMMSELLQSDITEDSATTAYLNYLTKLEEIARLKPCGIDYIEDNPGTEEKEDVVHVVARTTVASRKYYYRRYEDDSWMPWEQIKLDIEDDPVIPLVWNDRLLLFWLKILEQTPLGGQEPFQKNVVDGKEVGYTLTEVNTTKINLNAPSINVLAVLCWSEYHNGKWQPTKTSDIKSPASCGTFDAEGIAGSTPFDRSEQDIAVYEESETIKIMSETSGKAGGLTEWERLKAARPFGPTVHFPFHNSTSFFDPLLHTCWPRAQPSSTVAQPHT